jgi:1-acyl-sn-glycerol-3-phosphate acyltransferase
MMVLTRIRACIGAVFGVLWTLLFSILVFFLGALNRQRAATALIRVWSAGLLATFGVRVEVEGEENLPRAGGGIIVFNHQSHLDIPAIMSATDKQIRFGAKIELFRIPFFGAAMKSIGTLQIARDNRSEVLKIYQEAAKRFEDGILFVLAPEGTRQREPRLGRFKKGPFLFAMNARVPIIPVVLKGAFEVLPPKGLLINLGQWRRTIRVRFLPPIDSTRFTSDTLEAFVSETFSQMNAVFESLPSSDTMK